MTEDLHFIQRYLSGDRGAFEPLVDRYQKTVFNVALRMVNNTDDAADITQNVFIKASEKLDSFDPKYKFFSWIYRIAVNESINFVEAAKKNERLTHELVAEGKSPEDVLQDELLAQSVEEGLLRLTDDYRIVIILRHFENLSYDEIGFILDLPVRTVKSRLFSARQSLKKILSKRLER
jgi:RNA polymerase sigma-70 factor (ECF subfamily)